jgi:hypothetical protein
MSDLPLPDDELDELVSAVLDGVATPDERARVELDEALGRRLQAMRDVSALFAKPIDPPDNRDAQIAAAVAAFDGAAPIEPVITTVRSLDQHRSKRTRWLVPAMSVAAASFLTVGVIALATAGDDGGGESASGGAATTAASATGAATEQDASYSGADADQSAPLVVAAESRAADLTIAAATTAAATPQREPGVTTTAASPLPVSAPPDAGGGAPEINSTADADTRRTYLYSLTTLDELVALAPELVQQPPAIGSLDDPCPAFVGDPLAWILWQSKPSVAYARPAFANAFEVAIVDETSCTIVVSTAIAA